MITLDTSEVERNLAGLFAQMEARAKRACDRWARELMGYAKSRHAWQNRTGETERTTRTQVIALRDELMVYVFAETSYSKFLELAHGGEWSWLFPAVQAMEKRFYEILVEEFRGSGFIAFAHTEGARV